MVKITKKTEQEIDEKSFGPFKAPMGDKEFVVFQLPHDVSEVYYASLIIK